jgi:hypothetical protein
MNNPSYGPGRPLPGSTDEAAVRILQLLERSEIGSKSPLVGRVLHASEQAGGRDPSKRNPALLARTHPISARGSGRDIVYEYADGTTETWSGGTRSWRTNNPGNLHYDKFAPAHGAIGQFESFAIFPSESIGKSALNAWLYQKASSGSTLNSMMNVYAPPQENDTVAYQNFLSKLLGLPGSTLLSDLTPSQMRTLEEGIIRFEGWRTGTITRTDEPRP